jgi:hypothetical protein
VQFCDVRRLPLGGEAPSGKTGLIVVYDVFAYQVPQTRAQCDRLAKLLGCHVVLPDFYRGGVSPMSDPSLGDFMEVRAGAGDPQMGDDTRACKCACQCRFSSHERKLMLGPQQS